MLDAMIIYEYKGKKCLDHFMQQIYKNYYEKLGRGFSETEFREELSAFLHKDMTPFFDKYINGTEIPDFNSIFENVGLIVNYVGIAKPSFGASLTQSGGQVKVRGIRTNSAAENAGLSVDDEIIGCDGYRITQSDLEDKVSLMEAGDKMNLLISRDDVLLEIVVTLANFEKPQFNFTPKDSGVSGEYLNYWLREDE